ncbi:class I SAM-dependent methyltransferase [Pontibacter oryzae]|uniref:Class I SAM-dependent methyltransferase n=1 Tax=Pontibacter oryzae TaxID=2304593 RepID=A0A399S326_9BACT|nr:class I SAM-dependent methyltransferase [Pontibacter oryzae]RIJ36943.1 class I SAM-dependent methyltransferase [Pontibacter oryzae]
MKLRLQLFELEDQKWFPHVIREGMQDYLRFMITKLNTYEAALPQLQELLEHSRQQHITDLCSGAGGGIAPIRLELSKRMGTSVHVTLSDLYPNIEAYQYLSNSSYGTINFIPEPVDCTNVPPQVSGVRTIFSSFHHFPPETAQAILQDAVEKGASIGIFEGARKTWAELLLLWLVFPVIILLITPFIRPFKFSRLFFTYIIPLIPLGIIWDGTVSLLRIYPPEMLKRMVANLNAPGYTWQAGRVGSELGKHVIYLIGYPKEKENV